MTNLLIAQDPAVLADQTVAWMNSPAGKSVLEKSLQETEEYLEKLNQSRQIDPKLSTVPMMAGTLG